MSFSGFVPPLLTPEQSGALPDIVGKILSGYTKAVAASNLKPSLEEELKKAKLANKHQQLANIHAQLANQYYEPNMKSQLALRNAQMQSAQANAQRARMIQALQQQLLGINPNSNQQEGQNNDVSNGLSAGQEGQMENNFPSSALSTQRTPEIGSASSKEQYALTPDQIQRLHQAMPDVVKPMAASQTSKTIPASNYGKVTTAMQMLGLGKPQIVQDAEGKYVAITPFGNIDTGTSTLSERDKALSKEDAKKISGLENTALAGYQKQDTFDAMNQILGSPELEQIRQHPVAGHYELGYYEKFGTPAQQKMIGQLKAHMGQIIKDAAQDFKGQFRIGEQALVNSMKPNPGDSLDVMKGKAEALTYMNQMMTKRAELEARYMRDYHMSALQARVAANKVIKPSEVKKQINSILYQSKKKNDQSSKEPTLEEIRAEKARRQSQGLNNG